MGLPAALTFCSDAVTSPGVGGLRAWGSFSASYVGVAGAYPVMDDMPAPPTESLAKNPKSACSAVNGVDRLARGFEHHPARTAKCAFP
ncbi:hypothetical protein CBM2589_B120346 [Cupriavidus taiwanensis]|uniref:Uncharacterized protein n=1 Tax=Cupriavidus taiwanensis TaxID=164546 RepID=A0A375BH57_9BURK|nr:hypothetical protein CBM2589_B120346 [Cupriavidus taiwanensis]